MSWWLELKKLSSGLFSRQLLNSNFETIEKNTSSRLSRYPDDYSGVPSGNAMHVALDMNSNKILNILDPVDNLDVANKKYVDARGDYVLGLANIYTDQQCTVTLATAVQEAKAYTDVKHSEANNYTRDKVNQLSAEVDGRINDAINDINITLTGTKEAARYAVKSLEGQTEFYLPFTGFSTVEPFINGVLQSPYAYTLNENRVTFSEPLSSNDEVVFFVGVVYQFTDYQSVQSFNFEATEGQTVIELGFNPLAEGVMVFVQGVKQRESAYTLTASSIIFQEELQEGLEIEVLRLIKIQEDTQFLNAVSFFKQTIDNNVLIPAGYNGLSVMPVVKGTVTVSEGSVWSIVGEGSPIISVGATYVEDFIAEELNDQFDEIDDDILAGILATINN